MIENGYQLGAATPRIGPSPTGTPASVWSLDTTTDTFGKHRVEDAHAVLGTAQHEKAARPLPPGPAVTDHHDNSHHQEREQPT
ncbi:MULTISPECIES: hypothetical protein [Streptomyces]|uniref:Uncharacterized protein n=1 Tax=Streptomyces virginiae TaxID=1961 RepID=A0ABZ1TMN5_STRVG|nr:hypothetical protein [Streptomyces virginiae]WTB27138.1 hypothetical protein OG253_39905 [Streptomyces virginiae]